MASVRSRSIACKSCTNMSGCWSYLVEMYCFIAADSEMASPNGFSQRACIEIIRSSLDYCLVLNIPYGFPLRLKLLGNLAKNASTPLSASPTSQLQVHHGSRP